jgi:DNA polymerase-3 subunit delta
MTQTRAVDLVSQMTFFSDRKLVVIDEPAFIPCGQGQAKSHDENQSQDAAGDVVSEEDGVPDDGSDTGAGGTEVGTQQKRGRDAKNEDQPLLTYMGQPLSLSCLVLRCRSGKPDRRHKLTAEIVKLGGLVETTLRGPSERIPFLLEALAASGKQCGRGLLDQIARQPWSLTFCMRELDKTIAYAGGESTITQAMLDAVLTPSLESNIFRMVDALGARRRPDALRELRALLDSGESPFRIFPMMVRQYRLIFRAKACMVAGLRGGQIAQSLGVQPFIAQKSADQSRYYSTAELEEAMDLFCEKDLAMKSGIPPAQVLEDLVFELGK